MGRAMKKGTDSKHVSLKFLELHRANRESNSCYSAEIPNENARAFLFFSTSRNDKGQVHEHRYTEIDIKLGGVFLLGINIFQR